jgi:hypothetical protein
VIRHPDCGVDRVYLAPHGSWSWRPGFFKDTYTKHPPAIYASPRDPRTDDEIRKLFSVGGR